MINSVNRRARSQLDGDEFGPADVTDYRDAEFNRQPLTRQILHRIETRLPGRIRQLAVYAAENAIVLSGHCSTYYTKQIAQHAAMGALEYERLINNIDVDPPK